MATTYYTTDAIVKARLNEIATGTLTDSNIQDNIEMAEGMIDCVMRTSFKTTFDATKHGLIREAATSLATFMCLVHDAETNFNSASSAALTADLLWSSSDRALSILADQNVVTYLQGL